MKMYHEKMRQKLAKIREMQVNNGDAKVEAFDSKDLLEKKKMSISKGDKASLNKRTLDYYQKVKEGIKSCDKILNSLNELERMFATSNKDN
jgi:hypothetical protein